MVYSKLENIAERIKTGPGATSEKERKTNLELVVGLLDSGFISGDISSEVYGHPSTLDFENLIKQSPLEHSSFEFKQGLLSLDAERLFDEKSFEKIINTICAIANCGPQISGHLFIGICDKKDDALRVNKLDGVDALDLDGRLIVGVSREAVILKKSSEQYLHLARDRITKSKLSDPLKGAILGNFSMINYFGREVIHIGIPAQSEMAWVGEFSYLREADQTIVASGKKIAEIASRF